MIMMKQSLFTFLCISSLAVTSQTIKSGSNANNPEPIKLTNKMISIADGTIINGDDMVEMIRAQIDVRKLLLGTGLTENEHKACFYEGSYYTIKEMAVLEQKMRKNGLMQGDAFLAMGASLSAAKRSFLEEIAKPLLDKLRKGKKFTVHLVKESCEKHNRFDSILLEWEHTDDEHEIEVFMNRMDSFKTLGLFCLDVIHLIRDIIHSCPIAYQQFETMKKNYYAAEDASILDQVKAE
jgi:hypothetical protein